MRYFIKLGCVLTAYIITSCAGSIRTVKSQAFSPAAYKNICIISSENSQYIKFKFGTITPFGYVVPQDDPSEIVDQVGNTDLVLKDELEKYGFTAQIFKKGDQEILKQKFDLIIEYTETWRWDFKKVLDGLDILFISGKDDSSVARSTYSIYKNKELHNFPTPRKEVPKMIKALLDQ